MAAMRANSDEAYVVALCDRVLGHSALRNYRFPFLVGDSGRRLPVDAYYPDLKLVVEYRERQHTEAVPFFDCKVTVSGMPRGLQRARYDQLRRDVLPKNGIRLVELDYSLFPHGSRKRLLRTPGDVAVIRRALKSKPPSNNALERAVKSSNKRAAGARTIVAPAARRPGCARPAQRGR
jgi:hypothetical protein